MSLNPFKSDFMRRHDKPSSTKKYLDMNSEGYRLPTFTLSHSECVKNVKFSPDASLLLSCSTDGKVYLWNARVGQLNYCLLTHLGAVRSCTFSPKDGRMVASCGDDRCIKLWDVKNYSKVATLKGHTQVVWDINFSPGGTFLVSSSSDKSAKVWDTRDSKLVMSLEDHTEPVIHSKFSPDGRYICTCSWDKTLRIWDLQTRKTLHVLKGHDDWISHCSFSPKGNVLASSSHDCTVRLWNCRDGTEIALLQDHTSDVNMCLFSPNGQLLASASSDKTVRIFEIQGTRTTEATLNDKHTQSHELRGHQESVSAISFSQDGNFLVSASDDGTLRVYDAYHMQLFEILGGHTDRVVACDISPQGHLVASASKDGSVLVWDISRAQHTSRTCSVS